LVNVNDLLHARARSVADQLEAQAIRLVTDSGDTDSGDTLLNSRILRILGTPYLILDSAMDSGDTLLNSQGRSPIDNGVPGIQEFTIEYGVPGIRGIRYLILRVGHQLTMVSPEFRRNSQLSMVSPEFAEFAEFGVWCPRNSRMVSPEFQESLPAVPEPLGLKEERPLSQPSYPLRKRHP